MLRKYDILLIADEVITGFGRTGAMFGCETYGIEPDLITLAKGLTSAYVPLSASRGRRAGLGGAEEASERLGSFPHGYTYSGHPLGAAAANAVLDIVEAEDLPGNARKVGADLQPAACGAPSRRSHRRQGARRRDAGRARVRRRPRAERQASIPT